MQHVYYFAIKMFIHIMKYHEHSHNIYMLHAKIELPILELHRVWLLGQLKAQKSAELFELTQGTAGDW